MRHATNQSAPPLGKKRWGKRFLKSVLAELALIRDPRGPLIGSLIFWALFQPLGSPFQSSVNSKEKGGG